MKYKKGLTKHLLTAFLFLIGIFLILSFFNIFSINSLTIVSESTSIRNPLVFGFIGLALLVFVVIFVVNRKNNYNK